MYDEPPRYVYVPVERRTDPRPENTITLCGILFVLIVGGVFTLYAIHTLFTTFPVIREIWEAVWPWIKRAVTFLFSFRFF